MVENEKTLLLELPPEVFFDSDNFGYKACKIKIASKMRTIFQLENAILTGLGLILLVTLFFLLPFIYFCPVVIFFVICGVHLGPGFIFKKQYCVDKKQNESKKELTKLRGQFYKLRHAYNWPNGLLDCETFYKRLVHLKKQYDDLPLMLERYIDKMERDEYNHEFGIYLENFPLMDTKANKLDDKLIYRLNSEGFITAADWVLNRRIEWKINWQLRNILANWIETLKKDFVYKPNNLRITALKLELEEESEYARISLQRKFEKTLARFKVAEQNLVPKNEELKTTALLLVKQMKAKESLLLKLLEQP